MKQKPPKVRLIDDTGFLLQRVKEREEKPEFMFRSPVHAAWIRTLHCEKCSTLLDAREAAHLRIDTQTGKGITPHDYWMWPGCHLCHQKTQHIVGERTFWHRLLGIADPHRHILEKYALKSPCPATRDIAKIEHIRRYGSNA